MPANQKQFEDVKRTDWESLLGRLRADSFVVPYNDSGVLRGRDYYANMAFDEQAKTVSIYVRESPKNDTFKHLFDKIEDHLKAIR